MYRRKYVFTGIIIIAVIAIAGIIFAMFNVNKTIKTLNKENEVLQKEVDDYNANLTTVYQVVTDVKANNSIVSTDIEAVQTLAGSVPENVITDEDDLMNKMYKIDLDAFTYLTEDMIETEILTDDMRELDVVLDEVPIGIEEGDYVDIRIVFPEGQDFIVMTHKKIVSMSNNVLKLIVGEDDFYSYESAKTDKSYYNTTKLYAVRYVEAGLQSAAKDYYPVSLGVLKTRILDPNIDTKDYSETMKNREQLELQLTDWAVAFYGVEKPSYDVGTKSTIASAFEVAKEQYAELQAEKEMEMQYSAPEPETTEETTTE